VHHIFEEVARQNSVPIDSKLAGLRVLVVDNDERIRRSAHTILERQGCIVDAASTATDGIAMARVSTYDAVLCAIKHKDMGGTAAYRALVKAVPLGRVILTQGFEYDGGHTIVNVRQDGYWLPVIFKPFQEPKLFVALTCMMPSAPAGSSEPMATAS
jgi:two-component system, sensor histidine kinase SagS